MKKKIILPLMLLVTFGLTGCNNPGGDSSETPSNSNEPTTSEQAPSSTPDSSADPVEEKIEIYNYDFDAEDVIDTPALPNIDEGMGIVAKEGGYATTISDADLTEGVAPQWTFASANYDNDVPSFELETKTKVVSTGIAEDINTQVSAIRIAYDWALDIQLNVKMNDEGWSGVKMYRAGDSIELASSEALNLVPDTYYTITIRAILLEDEASMHFSVAIDGTNVIDLEKTAWKIDGNAKHGLGASQGSYVNWDYFKLSKVVNGK